MVPAHHAELDLLCDHEDEVEEVEEEVARHHGQTDQHLDRAGSQTTATVKDGSPVTSVALLSETPSVGVRGRGRAGQRTPMAGRMER